MKIIFKMNARFARSVRQDLARPHGFAAERVGFISVRAAQKRDDLILFAQEYYPLADEDYVDDPTVGAMMGQEAIRKALNIALLKQLGVFHVHVHEHEGRPGFSHVDLAEQLKFVPDFFKVCRQIPHGALVLSHDKAAGSAWLDPKTQVGISEFNTVGWRTIVDVVASSEIRGAV